VLTVGLDDLGLVPIDPAMTGVPFMASSVLLRRRRGQTRALLIRTVKRYGEEAGLELWKFPGGVQEFCDSANPLRTLNRELCEETGFYLNPSLKIDPPVLQRERTPNGHYRYFYLLWKPNVRGELEKKIREDHTSIILERDWKDLAFIEENLCRSHRGVLFKLRQLMR
jgi:8-oxo-dGTP pyrophosphatase MutT (NUDIX family)